MTTSTDRQRRAPVDPVFVALFFASGISALVYQTVWMRMLVRVFGGTVEAAATVVAVFMGGLALGGLLAGRMSRRRRFTSRTYALLELGIAASAIAATSGIRALPALLASMTSEGTSIDSLALLRVSLVALVLVVPAVLLGMTLPVLVDVVASDELGRPLAALYASNTGGSAAGVLGTGFIALGLLGETTTVLVAAGINAAVGAIVLGVRRVVLPPQRPLEPRADGDRDRSIALLGAVLGGGASLALEVVWTRLLTFLIGTSVYAFSTMIAAYLMGIVIGSACAAPFVDRVRRPGVVVAALLAGAGAAVVLSLRVYAWVGEGTLGADALQSPLPRGSDALAFAIVGVLVVMPVSAVFGALFLFATATYARGGHDVERVGRIYSLNTIAGVVGSLAAGFIAIPAITAQGTAVILAYVLLGAGALTLLASGALRGGARAVPVVIILVAVLAPTGNLIRGLVEGRLGAGYTVTFHAESREMSTTVALGEDGGRHLLLNGVLLPHRGALESGIADVPLLLHARPRTVLLVNLGAGYVFTTAVGHLRGTSPDWRVDIVEPVEDVIHAHAFMNELASVQIRSVKHVNDHLKDARSHLLVSPARYDVVIIDGTPPIFSSGSASSYSRELVALVRTRLAPGGILVVWAPYPAYASDIWSIAHAMQLELPHLRVSSGPGAHGAMLIASAEALDVAPDVLARRIGERRLTATGDVASELIRGFVDPAVVAARVARAPPITDDLPRIEYPLLHLLEGDADASVRPNLHDVSSLAGAP